VRVWIRRYLPIISRTARTIQYALLTYAGTWLITTPTALLQTSMGQVVFVWAAFLVVGGTLCTIGTATRLWVGEFTGLTLLITANFTWGVTLIGASTSSAKYGLVLVAWGFGLVAREAQVYDRASRAAGAGRARRRAGGSNRA
jgi:hypothetical protein